MYKSGLSVKVSADTSGIYTHFEYMDYCTSKHNSSAKPSLVCYLVIDVISLKTVFFDEQCMYFGWSNKREPCDELLWWCLLRYTANSAAS